MNEASYFENIASLKFLAKKEVGQNFLVDPRVCERIVGLLEAKEGEHLLEIGCGAGSLSYFLAQLPNQTDLIDIDEAMLAKVQEDFSSFPQIHPIYGNACRYDYQGYDKIIGNLPYYITSLIVERCLMEAKNAKKMVFMVQKEAAVRLLSGVGSKDYGPLPIYISLVSSAKRAFNVGRNSFVPAPHVDSSVIVLDILEEKHNDEALATYRFAQSMFLQRRKTIFNNLKAYLHDDALARAALREVGIAENLRPDALTPAQFHALAHAKNLVK